MRGPFDTRHLPLAAGILLAALTLGLKASARELWFPTADQYQTAERGEQCLVLRTLSQGHQREVADSRTQLQKQIDLLKARRAAVEDCARAKGIAVNGSDRAEGMMAEFCGPQYAMWIHYGYQLEMVKQDLQQATRDLTWLTGRLLTECPSPRGPASVKKAALPRPAGEGFLPGRASNEPSEPRGSDSDGALAVSGTLGGRGTRRGESRATEKKPVHTAFLRGNELPQ